MRILSLLIMFLLSLSADIGVVGALQGTANILRQGTSVTAFSGMGLQEHDAITTEEKSKVQLIMKDESIITIGPSSHFKLEAYQFQPDAQSNLDLRLQRGYFRAITGKIGKIAPERFKIRTKSATIGIRGTDFAAYVDQQSEYIGCIHGLIQVTSENVAFELKEKMMVSLINNSWIIQSLDIEKFHPLMISTAQKNDIKTPLKNPLDPSIIADITQQEHLKNAGFQITPGYAVDTTPTPPPFIP